MVGDMLRQPDGSQTKNGEPEWDFRRWPLDHVPERQRGDFGAKKNVSWHILWSTDVCKTH